MRSFIPSAFAILGVLAFGACVIKTNEETPKPVEDTGVIADTPVVPTSIRITRSQSAGDFYMSGRLGIDAGKLGVVLAAIRDPDALTKPVDPKSVQFEVTLGAGKLVCSIDQVSAASKGAVDLVFINDTTGSMSGTVKGIAASVEKFATDIAAAGVDARFSMYTYGDAFATKLATSSFKIGLGDWAPPSIDSTERPYVGLTDLSTFKGFLAELKASSALGNGGGDGEENTIGAIAYANEKLAFRDGAAHMYVAIGDNPSHQAGDGVADDYPDNWKPKTGSALVNQLQGNAAIHVVGRDTNRTKYYNLKTLADETGGAFLTLPSDGNVDLGALKLTDWLTRSFSGTCNDPTLGTTTVVISAKITGTRLYTGTLTFDVIIE